MTSTKYDYDRLVALRKDRSDKIAAARQIIDTAKSEKRELHRPESEAVEAASTAVKSIDSEMADQNQAMLKAVLGSPDDRGSSHDGVQYLSLRTPRTASDLAARFGNSLGAPGMKALLDAGDPYTTIPMDPQVYALGAAPTALAEIIPAITTPVSYRFMQQTSRTNAAAPVAPGALKPTSVYGLTPVDGRLHVIAHISEAMDKYVLQDASSLVPFVQLEMVNGLHQALEAQLISGTGIGENLTGLSATSGIQTQAFTTNPILTARAAITKVEVLSFEPYYFLLSPIDWAAVETTQLTAGAYVLNAEGQRSGVPVDQAARRLWGIPVAVSTGVPAGTGYLLSNGAVQLATDGRIETEWSSSFEDDFGRNQVRLRVESRFDLAALRPLGVVQMDLTA